MANYHVTTIASGETYEGGFTALLHLGGNAFAPVSISRLERMVRAAGQSMETGAGGYHVLFHNQRINQTMAQLDAQGVLEAGSTRYQDAKQLVHVQNRNGGWIPKLRVGLIEGFVPTATRQEVLREGADISSTVYTQVVGDIASRMGTYLAANPGALRMVQPRTMREWVQGEVVAPDDRRTFDALRGVHQFFDQFSSDRAFYYANQNRNWSEPHNNLEAAYHIWEVIRQGVMSYISRRPSGSSNGGRQGGGQRQRLTLADELSHVVNYFATMVGDDHARVLLTNITTVEQGPESGSARNESPNPKLGWGLVSPGSTPGGVCVVAPGELIRDLGILRDIIHPIIMYTLLPKGKNLNVRTARIEVGECVRMYEEIYGCRVPEYISKRINGSLELSGRVENTWRSLHDGTGEFCAEGIRGEDLVQGIQTLRNLFGALDERCSLYPLLANVKTVCSIIGSTAKMISQAVTPETVKSESTNRKVRKKAAKEVEKAMGRLGRDLTWAERETARLHQELLNELPAELRVLRGESPYDSNQKLMVTHEVQTVLKKYDLEMFKNVRMKVPEGMPKS